MESEKSFLSGAFLLMGAGVLVKLIGALYKIPLTNLLGAEGMALFSVAYNFYTALFVLSTSGLPVAVAKLVAAARATGKTGEIRVIVTCGAVLFGFCGFFLSLFMICFSGPFASLVGSSGARWTVVAIAPSVFFTALISVYRGYYQGLSQMGPTAISQIIEALGKLIFGYSLALFLLRTGYPLEICAAGAVLGVSIGTFFSAGYLFLLPKSPHMGRHAPYPVVARGIVALSIPVALGASVLSVTGVIDTFQIMNRLQQAGFTGNMAAQLYGAYTMSLTIASLPQAVVSAISIAIIPVISAAFARGDKKALEQTTRLSLRVTALLSLPAGLGLTVLARPILGLLYYRRPSDVALAAPILLYLGFSVVFVSLTFVSVAILQATGRARVPVFTMLLGAVVKICVSYVLMGDLRFHIYGAAIGSICCYALITFCNLFIVLKGQRWRFFAFFLKISLATWAMSGVVWWFYSNFSGGFPNFFTILLAICLGAVIYLGINMAIGGITACELALLPCGKKLARILETNEIKRKL